MIAMVLCTISIVYGQENVKIVKSEFKKEKEYFRDAWKCIQLADKDYDAGGGLYPEAMKTYLLAWDYNKDNAELNYKIGVSCLFGTEIEKSIVYLLKAYELKQNVATDILLLCGRAYQLIGDYGKAIDCYNIYSDDFHDSKKFNLAVNTYINECNTSIDASASAGAAEVINPGTIINSSSDDYSAVPANGGETIYFSTRRNIDRKRDRQDIDMKWDENIFSSSKSGGGWTLPVPAGDELISRNNEGILTMNSSEDKMYVYAGYSDNGDVFVSVLDKGQWSKPQPVRAKVNSKARETSFAITDDENEIFFTSDRKKGGMGGRDIYFIKRIRKEKWTKPVNLGENVNSQKNEESLYISSKGDSLWFSSNGHNGLGGYDIYLTVKDGTGSWSDPVNLGMPVNSQANDLFYRPSPFFSNEAWMSSDRTGGIGGMDIYNIIYTVPDIVPDTVIIEEPVIITEVPDTIQINEKMQVISIFNNQN